jgi:hypothetical protein
VGDAGDERPAGTRLEEIVEQTMQQLLKADRPAQPDTSQATDDEQTERPRVPVPKAKPPPVKNGVRVAGRPIRKQ